MQDIPYSLAGRNIIGRSTAGYDVRIKDQPIWHREQQLPMNHIMAPPETVVDYYGRPLTEAEQKQKHYGTFGTTDLPPIGTGLAGNPGVSYGAGVQRLQGFDWGVFVAGGLLGLIFGYFIFTASGRKIGYRAGERVARRI